MGTCQFPSGTGTLWPSAVEEPLDEAERLLVVCETHCMARDKVLRCHTWRWCELIWADLELLWSCGGVDCSDEICWMNFRSQWPNFMMNDGKSPLNFASESAEGWTASLPASCLLFNFIRFEEIFPVSKSTVLRCLRRPTSPGARSAALCTVSRPALPMSCPKSSGRSRQTLEMLKSRSRDAEAMNVRSRW